MKHIARPGCAAFFYFYFFAEEYLKKQEEKKKRKFSWALIKVRSCMRYVSVPRLKQDILLPCV